MNEIVFLWIIANRKLRDDLIKEVELNHGKLINIIYGHGTCRKGDIFNALGLVDVENKVILTSLIKKCKSKEVIDILNTKYEFSKPNTGIAFTILVDNVKY